MGWRSLMIARPATLRRAHFSLAIEQDEVVHVPFEDIAIIVLDHREIRLTHPVLAACADYGISLFATGDTHQPNGVFLPFLTHTRSTRLLRKQLAITRPLVKNAWAEIVRRKIANQSACLQLCALEGSERLDSYVRRMRSGDPENLEAQAAAFYFRQLFGLGFQRAEARWVNSALNYGYAVLRGAIARGLVAHGLHPSFGLFHDSEQNAFNLADDLIEAFRPVVDLFVRTHAELSSTESLLPTDKAALIALLNVDVGMASGKMSVLSAIEYAVESLCRIYEQEECVLDLPVLLGLSAHQREY